MVFIIASLFIILFLIIYKTSKNDFEFSLITVTVTLLFFPQYISILNIRYFTIINTISLILNIKYFIANQTPTYHKQYVKYLIIYLGILQFWSVLNGTFLETIQLEAFKNILGYFSIATMCFIYINKVTQIKFLERYLKIFLLIVCIYGIYCYITNSNIITTAFNLYFDKRNDILDHFKEESRGGLAGRIQGFTEHPLEYGGAMLCAFFYFLQINLYKKKKLLIDYILFALICINIFLSGSRAAIIAFLIGFALFIYVNKQIKYKTKIRITLYFIGLYFILATCFSFFDTYSGFIKSIIFFWENNDSVKGSNFDMRLTQLNASFDLVSNDTISYLFGLGDGWVRDYSQRHGGLHPVLLGFESILFIGIIEYGIIGFFVLTCGIYYIYFKLANKYHISNVTKIFIVSFFIFQMFTGEYALPTFLSFVSIMIKTDIQLLINKKKI
jgi:hypothetical protein